VISGHTTERVLNAMTVDVEDYYHVSSFDHAVARSTWNSMESRVCGNTRRLLDIFDAYGVRGTFFVLGWLAERHGELVREIAQRGHEVASHGYGHRLVYEQTPAAFRADVRLAKRLLEDVSGTAVKGYRAPSFSITTRSLWALDILIEEGYAYDSSIFPIRHDRYGIPASPRHAYVVERATGSLVEVPGTTVRLASVNVPVAGGGYFRILPYAWTRWGINRLNRRERRPAVFYVHPWEIDPAQPRLPAGVVGQFRHYRNLHKTEGRLRALLGEFAFEPLGSLLSRGVLATATEKETGFDFSLLEKSNPVSQETP
jgi:polysaccharide deacetylase family protein (PEP-CTERM system associated)